METNEKFFTDQEFKANKIEYHFTAYPSRRQYQNNETAARVITWCNNDLTRYTAQNILQGIAAGASLKYKHPFAVLYAITQDGTRIRLSSCQR